MRAGTCATMSIAVRSKPRPDPARRWRSSSIFRRSGVRTAIPDGPTGFLRRAIDRAAGARLPLVLSPGIYRARGLVLPTGARLIGVPGATRLVAIDSTPLIVARGADYILLSGITFDGSSRMLPENAGLIQIAAGRGIAIRDCEIIGAGRNGIVF